MALKRIANVARYHRDGIVARALVSALGLVLVLAVTAAEAAPTRDFSSDLKEDILWLNVVTGQVAIWLIDGTVVTSTSVIVTQNAPWAPLSGGDFNGDGDADILWLQIFTGQVAIWLMNGTSPVTTAVIATVPGWTAVDLGDFNGDGRTDILWRNGSGQTAIWLMNGTVVQSAALIANVATTWRVAGVGDFDGDGNADILWHNTDDGQVSVWLMNGTALVATIPLATVATTWEIEGVSDFDGDGTADILWRQSDGTLALWLMNGGTVGTTSVASSPIVSTVSTSWQVAGIKDFNGDGNADILWRRTTGEVAIWLMDGPAVLATGVIGINVSNNWSVQ